MEKIRPLDEVIAENPAIEKFIRYSRLPEASYSTRRLQLFKKRKGAEAALAGAIDMAEGQMPHHFLTLVGEPGTGKTHLAQGITWEWLLHRWEPGSMLGLYYHSVDLFDDMRKKLNPDSNESIDRFLYRVKQAILLVLDDLGTEKVTDWTAEKLDAVIDWRYENGLATIVTTNLPPDKLEKRIASRLGEGVVAVLECSDYRDIKAKERGR